MLYEQTTLNCNGQLVDLSEPVVMGVINVTPDSFFTGSRHADVDKAVRQAEKMLTEGGTILDIGGMSSRPGAEIISEKEELKRVLPPLKAIVQNFPNVLISIDTIRASVARVCVAEGASIVNDISAGKYDMAMFETIAELQNIPYILMHMKGDTPGTMQKQAAYDEITIEIMDFFIEKLGILRGLGIKDIIIDPGFGFGKTINHNYQLINQLHAFKILDIPILAGLSRKSMIWKTLNITPEEALNGTSILNFVALQQGAQILRVHDVKEAVEAIRLFKKLESALH